MLGALWLIQRRVSRRTGGSDRQAPVRVIAKQGLGAKTNLVVVEVEGLRYVLGVSERAVSVIDRLPADPARQAPAHPTALPDDGDLAPPLPLRRTLHHSTAPGLARSVGRSNPATHGAAQALRRALGA